MFPETPRTLLRRMSQLAAGRDAAEWEAFVELYTPPLRRFVRQLRGGADEADIDDVVQDVFVRLVKVVREGQIDRGKGKFRSYLAAMTRRILIDRYRAERVRPQPVAWGTVPGETGPVPGGEGHGYAGSVPGAAPESVPGAALDPGVAVDIAWRQAVHAAAEQHVMTKTAVSEQSKLIYRELERGLSPREVAGRFGVSRDVVKQVKSRIDRAIAAIELRFAD